MITSSIVTYKTDSKEFDVLLKCILDSSIEKTYIVDNSPTDCLRYCECFAPKIEYIFGQGNIGYGAAHNIAIRESIILGAKYHIVINPDIQFAKGVIESLSSYMDNNPNIGQIMPRVVYPDGELQYLCKLLPTPMDLIGRRFLPFKHYVEKKNYKLEMRASNYNKIMEVPFLSGCFMFFRIEALALVGGFSSRYWMYCEDLDLCRRIGEYYKTVYYPLQTIVHSHKKESYKNNKILIEHIKSAIKYFNYWGWIFDKKRVEINNETIKQY